MIKLNSRKIKFCFILGNYFEQVSGGAEYQAYLFAKRLHELCHEVHYIYIDNGNEFKKNLHIYLHPIKRNSLLKRFRHYALIVSAPRILKKLKKINPDVIYQRTGTIHTGIAAYYATRFNKCFVWHVAHDMDVLPAKFNFKSISSGAMLEKKVIKWGVSKANIIIGQSSNQSEALYANFGKYCTEIIPNYHPMPEAQIQKRLGKVKIVWVANSKPWKQPELFFELANAFKNHPQVSFLMAGRMNQGKQKVFIDKLEEVSNVQHVGEIGQNEVNELLEQSHIFVNTSIHEGFPNTFIQSWLRKVPVLSLCVNPDGIITRENIGFCSGNITRMIHDCKRLVENVNLRNEMGERAFAYAVKNHSLNNIDKIICVIDRSYVPGRK